MIWWFVAGAVFGVMASLGYAREFMKDLRKPKHFWERRPCYSCKLERYVPARRCLKCQRYEVDHGAGFVVVSEGRACNDANAHA